LRRRRGESDDARKLLFVGVELVDFDDLATNDFFVDRLLDAEPRGFRRRRLFPAVGLVDVVGLENDAPRRVVVVEVVLVDEAVALVLGRFVLEKIIALLSLSHQEERALPHDR